MIDSLLFLTDDVTTGVVDPDPAPADPFAGIETLGVASTADAAGDDARVAEAVEATCAGHAHADRGEWPHAVVPLTRSAELRDALVAAEIAGPAVAVRGWADVATAHLAAGDDGSARAALARARTAARAATEIPTELEETLAELAGELDGTGYPTPSEVPVAPTAPIADGLLWLDTADVVEEETAPAPAPDPIATAVDVPTAPVSAPPVPEAEPPAAPARIAAIDDAVALATPERNAAPAAGGLAARLRRLIRR